MPKKYSRAGQTTGGNIIRLMRIACWIPNGTNTHSEYVILIFHFNSGFGDALQCYAERSYSSSVLPSHRYVSSVVKLVPPL